ncbi:LOW QUALITY PROTEIN: queen brain-selective protein-1 [Mycetomoellerius zeteki]|uniref:LOW QUALITY PROTEIN: queen brain-selective protein-1 n=1 Tax=Mycetomoellerius zeteki TaxID=64791 RepID=UPI003CC8BE6C
MAIYMHVISVSDRWITMLTFQLTYMIVLLAAIFLIDKCRAHPAIAQRHEPRPLCRRGPGQICGGPSDSWGVCGDGLICSCNRCTGCSVDNLTCFANTCLPHQSLETRSYPDIFDNFPIDRFAKNGNLNQPPDGRKERRMDETTNVRGANVKRERWRETRIYISDFPNYLLHFTI